MHHSKPPCAAAAHPVLVQGDDHQPLDAEVAAEVLLGVVLVRLDCKWKELIEEQLISWPLEFKEVGGRSSLEESLSALTVGRSGGQGGSI